MKHFALMKENVKRILKDNRSKFSFNIDAWIARNGKSFYGITVHFIDNNWNFQSFALDLVACEGEHSGTAIAKIFFATLKEYGIENKVGGITVDNASANTTFMTELKRLMAS